MTSKINAAKAGIALLLAVTLSACATRLGRDFDDAYAGQIKPGETTKAEILGKLGTPSLVTGTAEGEIWTYAYYEGRDIFLFGGEDIQKHRKQKRLIVAFQGDSVKDSQFRWELPLPDRANR